MSEQDTFTLSAAKQYWKHAPSALGKVNSEELVRLQGDVFHAEWHEQLEARRHHYYEEKLFTELFCRRFRGQRVLSFGSGLGFNEVQFLRAGAELTCADIVDTNLDVISRVCEVEGHDRLSVLRMGDSSRTEFGGPFDFIYVWGSLMTMPFPMQREVMRNFRRALAPGGAIILLLYTREFLNAYCDEDSPTEFAKASDPSVGDCHNPWSDWHDDAKLLDLASDEMAITERQFWNQGLYVTYTLARKPDSTTPSAPPKTYFRIADEVARGTPIYDGDLRDLETFEASSEAMADGAVRLTTGENPYSYAAMSEPRTFTPRPDGEEATGITLAIDSTLEAGAFSIGILDVERDAFVKSLAVTAPGRHLHAASCDERHMPRTWRLVISNHNEAGAASRFAIHSIDLRLAGAPHGL